LVKKSRKDGRDIYLCEVCGFGYETAWLNLQPTHGEEASPPPMSRLAAQMGPTRIKY